MIFLNYNYKEIILLIVYATGEYLDAYRKSLIGLAAATVIGCSTMARERLQRRMIRYRRSFDHYSGGLVLANDVIKWLKRMGKEMTKIRSFVIVCLSVFGRGLYFSKIG